MMCKVFLTVLVVVESVFFLIEKNKNTSNNRNINNKIHKKQTNTHHDDVGNGGVQDGAFKVQVFLVSYKQLVRLRADDDDDDDEKKEKRGG